MSQESQDDGSHMCPGWVRAELAKIANGLDGRHDHVMVAGVVLMGPHGFDARTCEQAVDLDPESYGPMMLWGYSALAGTALANVLSTVYESTQHPDHFTQQLDDPEDHMDAIRNLYEAAVRQWLEQAITQAGEKFQADHPHNLSMAAGSQMLNVWLEIARRTIRFNTSPTQEQTDGDQQQERTG